MLISVNGVTNNLTINLPNKSYSDITLFLNELNLLLLNKITNILDKQIMPSLDTYQLSDIIFMLIQHFSDCDNTNYKSKIDFIIDLDTSNIIEQHERDKIYNVIYDFVKWFKQLK